MDYAGYPRSRIERFSNCGGAAHVIEHKTTHEVKTRAFFCHDRWCDACASARQMLIGDNLFARIKELENNALHVVLTTKHKNTPLDDQLTDLLKHFKQLRQLPIWKHAVKGACYAVQNHVAESDGLWHLHLHIIADLHTIAGSPAWLDEIELSLAWHQVTGDSTNVKVKRIHDAESICREVCRYAAKPLNTDQIPSTEKLIEALVAFRSRRLISTTGTWRGFKLTEQPPPGDPEDWTDHGSLVTLTYLAGQGDKNARKLLDRLWDRKKSARAPPELF